MIEAVGYEVECDQLGLHNFVIIKITRTSDGEVVYGGDCEVDDCQCPQHLWHFYSNRTFANTLPRDICQALWDYQQECRIEGFEHLDREEFFGEEEEE